MSETNSTRICVPVCAGSISELVSAAERAAKVGDLIELRLDNLSASELSVLQQNFAALLDSLPHQTIFTLRPANQGGSREIDNLSRVLFWAQFFSETRGSEHLADLELELARFFQNREREGQVLLDWRRVICSEHDFCGTPADPTEIYEQLSQTPAAILKIAVRAVEATDSLPLFRLLERARSEGRPLIAVAMGEPGLVTRILGPSHGSYLTYGSLDEAHRTAPGQLRAQHLRSLYRIDRLDRRATITGLMGSPVIHSVSPHMHNSALAALSPNAVYLPFEVHEPGPFMRRMIHPQTRELDWNLRGLSVTAPHKTAVIEHLDYVSPEAAEIGAVNTIVVTGEELHGFNTDAPAFIRTLTEKAGPLDGLSSAVIGAGGAARAVLWGLRAEGAQATIFARDRNRATALAEKFGNLVRPLEGASFAGFDVVINTTPLGTHGPMEGETPATAEQLRGARLAYDLVYNPAETRFMSEARAAECETMGGLPMLAAQAAEQFSLWFGIDAPIELMLEAARAALYGQDSSQNL